MWVVIVVVSDVVVIVIVVVVVVDVDVVVIVKRIMCSSHQVEFSYANGRGSPSCALPL